MSNINRRRFLRTVAQSAGAAGALALLPQSIRRALAVPAASVTGTIQDVQHVVILMQENRSFDHYFGTMAGVRGYGDRITVPMPGGKSVFTQSNGTIDTLPFHLDTTVNNSMIMPDMPHGWTDAQEAWNNGSFGNWPQIKGFQSMGYYEDADIPFQRALASAFTLCDAHHCSIMGSTSPNRVMFFSATNHTPGMIEPATDGSQAMINNNNGGPSGTPYSWATYPERLQNAGVSWQVYQDPNDNYDGLMNGLESFSQYRFAAPSSPLYQKGMSLHTLADLQTDVTNGTLPQVSWILPPAGWSEHPGASSPFQGAAYTQQVLNTLTSNPDLWSKTVFILTFDENDGLFDHVPPPVLPSYNADGSLAGATTLSTPTTGEYYSSAISGVTAARPYGLGARVPMYLISPWSRGGWINSQVFDQTSVIRFLEARFGVAEPNITPWHRAVSGDLTSCFDFKTPNDDTFPALPVITGATEKVPVINLPALTPPSTQMMPVQAQGSKPSRALPYELHTSARVDPTTGNVELLFANSGTVGAVFHVYDRLHLDRIARRYTVEAGKQLNDTWNTSADAGAYDLWVMSQNGFLRHFTGAAVAAGTTPSAGPLPEVQVCYDATNGAVYLHTLNNGGAAANVMVTANAYFNNGPWPIAVPTGGTAVEQSWPLAASGNWYDFTVTVAGLSGYTRRFAGRVETGADSVTDPAMGMGTGAVN